VGVEKQGQRSFKNIDKKGAERGKNESSLEGETTTQITPDNDLRTSWLIVNMGDRISI